MALLHSHPLGFDGMICPCFHSLQPFKQFLSAAAAFEEPRTHRRSRYLTTVRMCTPGLLRLNVRRLSFATLRLARMYMYPLTCTTL